MKRSYSPVSPNMSRDVVLDLKLILNSNGIYESFPIDEKLPVELVFGVVQYDYQYGHLPFKIVSLM